MTDEETLKTALNMLNSDNLKVGNIFVNYDIQKALIKLVKKKLKKKKKEWVGLTDYEVDQIEIAASSKSSAIYLSEAKLKEKNT